MPIPYDLIWNAVCRAQAVASQVSRAARELEDRVATMGEALQEARWVLIFHALITAAIVFTRACCMLLGCAFLHVFCLHCAQQLFKLLRYASACQVSTVGLSGRKLVLHHHDTVCWLSCCSWPVPVMFFAVSWSRESPMWRGNCFQTTQ